MLLKNCNKSKSELTKTNLEVRDKENNYENEGNSLQTGEMKLVQCEPLKLLMMDVLLKVKL